MKLHFPTLHIHFDRITLYLIGLLTLVSLIGYLGALHWTLDLFSHFRVQYLQIALLIAGFSLWGRRNKRAVALLAIAAFNYAPVLPFYFGKPPVATEKPVRIMQLNLSAANTNDTDWVLRGITNAQPDLVVLAEVTPDWAFELAQIASQYPHHILKPQEGCFGIALLSKYPLEHERIVRIGPAGVPSIIADAYLPQGTVSLIATHPLPPISAEYAKKRNLQLAALPDVVHEQKHPVLLIGDLNTSPWSFYFTRLRRASGLKNSMQGFGFQPTWPARHPFLRIPLDHVLHSPEIIIHNRTVGTALGSDHLPLIVDFSIE